MKGIENSLLMLSYFFIINILSAFLIGKNLLNLVKHMNIYLMSYCDC